MTTALRIFFLFIALAFAGALAAYIAGQDGRIVLTFGGLHIETSMAVAFGALLLLVFGALLLDRFLSPVFASPGKALEALSSNRRKRGETALTRGLVALAAGDENRAKRESKRALKLLNKAPLSLLLGAQAHARDNDDKAVTYYTAMLDDPQTEFLGRRGLFEMALKRNDFEWALAQAHRAIELKDKAPWALDAVFILESRNGDWAAALVTLQRAFEAKLLTHTQFKRRKAILLTAWAKDCAEQSQAQSKVLEALALAPDLVPAVTLAAHLLNKDNERRKAEGIVEKAWMRNPHPDLATSYDALAEDEPRRIKLERLDRLVDLNPYHQESRLIAAGNAIARQDFEAAHSHLTALNTPVPTARVLALRAELVRAEENNSMKARKIMTQALNAPREGEWTCHRCGDVAAAWTALCPACGEFDGLVWRPPHSVPDQSLRISALMNRKERNTTLDTLMLGDEEKTAGPIERISGNSKVEGVLHDVDRKSELSADNDLSGMGHQPDDPGLSQEEGRQK